MGCCIRKPVVVYQSILDECYNLLNQHNVTVPKTVVKKKQHKLSTDFGQNQENIQFISEFTEITPHMMTVAEASYNKFRSQDIAKLEGQVKLQAKTLSDHIQDTHIFLIDTVKYLKCQLKNYETEYGGQWITLQILEVLVSNLKNYTQKHISLKQAQQEDSNMVSKIDNLTENNEGNASVREENQYNQQANNPQQDQITFFSDNFIRFEIDFIEIGLFILNEKYNPFYAKSQNQFMNILMKFSQIHKDTYTSDKVLRLVDQLEIDLVKLTKQIVSSCVEESPVSLENRKKMETLSILQATYQATLSKLKTQQNVFRSKQQLHFFTSNLQTIMDFNKLLGDKFKSNNNSPQAMYENKMSNPQTVEDIIHEIKANCLGIISIFARRGFILKNQNALQSILFKFFDEVKWNSLLQIEDIINETITVARFESVQVSYRAFLIDQLTDYLLCKQQSGASFALINNNFQTSNINNNNNNRPQSLNEISQGQALDAHNSQQENLKFENFSDQQVKKRAFRLFNNLVNQNDNQTPLIMLSTDKIVKCFLENLKDLNEPTELKKAIQESFVHYTLQLAPDSSALIGILASLSAVVLHSNQSRSPQAQGISQNQPQNLYRSFSQISNQNNPNQLGIQQENNEYIKYVTEGLNLMLFALECGSSFKSSSIITDEVISNLINISYNKQVSLIVFEIIQKLFSLKINPAENHDFLSSQSPKKKQTAMNIVSNIKSNLEIQNNQNGNENNNLEQMFQSISENSLLHIFHQQIRFLFYLNTQQDLNDIYNAVVIQEYTLQVVHEITKRQSVSEFRTVYVYLIKLVNETISYQSSNNNLQLQNQQHASIDPSQFNSTNNQVAIQFALQNGQQNQPAPPRYHPVTYNLAKIAIIQILKALDQSTFCSQKKFSFQDVISILENNDSKNILTMYKQLFQYHKDIIRLHEQQNYKINQNSKNIGFNRQLTLQKDQSQFGNVQFQEELQSKQQAFFQLYQQIRDHTYIQSEAFNNNTAKEKIEKIAKESKFYYDKDFDELTAQFDRQIATRFQEMDFNHYIDDESLYQSVSRTIRNSQNNNNFQHSNTNESFAAYEKEDEQFGNVLNMIQTKNPIYQTFNLNNHDQQGSNQRQINNQQIGINAHDIQIELQAQ